jgi:hypothetical protein
MRKKPPLRKLNSMKRAFRLLAWPVYLTILTSLLAISSTFAQDAKPKPAAEGKSSAKPAAENKADATETETEDEEGASVEEILAANAAVLDNIDAAATLLDSIKDVKSAKIAAAKLKVLSRELKGRFMDMNELGEPSEGVEEELATHKELPIRGKKVADHFQGAVERLTGMKDKEPFEIISAAFQEYGAIAKAAGKEPELEEEPTDVPPGEKKPATLEEAMKLTTSILDNMDKASGILESVKDTASAKEASGALDEATAELKRIVKATRSLGELRPDDKKKMESDTKMAARGEKVGERFQKAAAALLKLEDKAAAATLSGSLQAYGNAAQSLNK